MSCGIMIFRTQFLATYHYRKLNIYTMRFYSKKKPDEKKKIMKTLYENGS